MTPISDTLVQFAAKKVGDELVEVEFKGHTIERGHFIEKRIYQKGWYAHPYSLTSWALLGRGLEAAKAEGLVFTITSGGCIMVVGDEMRDYPIELFQDVADIPLRFWMCYARLLERC